MSSSELGENTPIEIVADSVIMVEWTCDGDITPRDERNLINE